MKLKKIQAESMSSMQSLPCLCSDIMQHEVQHGTYDKADVLDSDVGRPLAEQLDLRALGGAGGSVSGHGLQHKQV